MDVALSIVLPAYNELDRLPHYLKSMREYFAQTDLACYEIIVVDDGSLDGLPRTIRHLAKDWSELKLLRHPRNSGKGAAVRTGMLAASGALLLFADADGATPIEEERRLRTAIQQGADVAVGSRLLKGQDEIQSRTWPRALCGRLFATAVKRLLAVPVRDTQCGFKMFRRDVGLRLFRLVEERGYLFDLELLILAQSLGFRVAEIPVHWRDMPGSKLRLAVDSWKMLGGLWKMRRSSGVTIQSRQSSNLRRAAAVLNQRPQGRGPNFAGAFNRGRD